MSDRPMRLKYLTKMKIILCIFLLYITAVSVFGQSLKLNGFVGKSIEFPAAVETGGSLMYGSKANANASNVTIGRILGGALLPLTEPEYKGRVHWDSLDSSTGHFSLSELRLEDSGVYTVENDGQTSVSTFNLTVWEDNVNVSKPHLNVTRNEYRCTVLCAAARGTGVTLTLYREGEKNPYVTSPGHSHPHLNVTQTVESGTYTCEAKNSVSSKTSDPLTVGAHCTVGPITAPPCSSAGTIVLVLFLVFLSAVLICLLCCSHASFSTVEIFPAIVVTLIAVLIYLLYCSPAGSSTWIVVLVTFLIFALIAVLISFCIRSEHPAVSRIIIAVCMCIQGIRSVNKGDAVQPVPRDDFVQQEK